MTVKLAHEFVVRENQLAADAVVKCTQRLRKALANKAKKHSKPASDTKSK